MERAESTKGIAADVKGGLKADLFALRCHCELYKMQVWPSSSQGVGPSKITSPASPFALFEDNMLQPVDWTTAASGPPCTA